MGPIPCSAMTASSMPRRPSRPPWMRGWRVLTRPAMISGNRVDAERARTAMPAVRSAWAVPPVDSSSTPRAARPRAKSPRPCLSETDSSARVIAMDGWGPRALLGESHRAQFLAQRGAGDPEDHRGLALVAIGVVEYGLQERFLDFTQHEVVQPRRPVAVEVREVIVQHALGVAA